MKIELIPTGGGAPVTLAEDNAAREGARDPKSQITRLKQPVPAIGAPQYDDEDRGNQRTTLTFSASKPYATMAAAVLAWLDSDSIMDLKGTLKITEGGTTRYLPNASVHGLANRPQGIRVHCTYTITGGKLTAILPV